MEKITTGLGFPNISVCPTCGGTSFAYNEVLWPELIKAWQLSEDEIRYVNLQQGWHCVSCRSMMRSMVLAKGLLRHFKHPGPLAEFVQSQHAARLEVLEINEAGNLNPFVNQLPRHQLVNYPEVDMKQLPIGDDYYDLVIHSDTLEHVPDPIHGLRECKRVLKKGGALLFTVPVIVDRMTKDRKGLPKSWHGNPVETGDDFLVQTEFGADAWAYILRAGFDNVRVEALDFPCAIAFLAIK